MHKHGNQHMVAAHPGYIASTPKWQWQQQHTASSNCSINNFFLAHLKRPRCVRARCQSTWPDDIGENSNYHNWYLLAAVRSCAARGWQRSRNYKIHAEGCSRAFGECGWVCVCDALASQPEAAAMLWLCETAPLWARQCLARSAGLRLGTWHRGVSV